jgi:esterase/lipase
MSINYAEKFGFSQKIVKGWQDEEIFLKGENNTLIILVPGWSAIPRQFSVLAKKLNKKGFWVDVIKISGHATKPEDLYDINREDWVNDVIISVKKARKMEKIKKIILVGVSMGGNLCLLASLRIKVEGIVLIGVPVHLKGHFQAKMVSIFLPFFKKYMKKTYPNNIVYYPEDSYQYFPTKNIREVLLTIRNSVFLLKKVVAPILILQTREDFFVTKYSPWIIYKNVSSKIKRMQWIATKKESHVPRGGEELGEVVGTIEKFLRKI